MSKLMELVDRIRIEAKTVTLGQMLRLQAIADELEVIATEQEEE